MNDFNFEILTTGKVYKRPGTKFIKVASDTEVILFINGSDLVTTERVIDLKQIKK